MLDAFKPTQNKIVYTLFLAFTFWLLGMFCLNASLVGDVNSTINYFFRILGNIFLFGQTSFVFLSEKFRSLVLDILLNWILLQLIYSYIIVCLVSSIFPKKKQAVNSLAQSQSLNNFSKEEEREKNKTKNWKVIISIILFTIFIFSGLFFSMDYSFNGGSKTPLYIAHFFWAGIVLVYYIISHVIPTLPLSSIFFSYLIGGLSLGLALFIEFIYVYIIVLLIFFFWRKLADK